MDHRQVQAREKSEPLWQLAKVHESKQDENQAITVLSTKRVNESRRTTRLSWVYGGNVAIAEFSPSLNFNIW